PLLVSDDPTVPFDFRGPSTVMDGIVNTIANNAEPIKLLLYTLIFGSAIWWIYSLYQNARDERDRALIAQSNFLAQTAHEHVGTSDPELGMLLALEGLRDSKSQDSLQKTRPYVAAAEASLYDSFYQHRQVALFSARAPIAAADLSIDGTRFALAA